MRAHLAVFVLASCAGEPEPGMYVSYEIRSLRELDRVHVVLTGGPLTQMDMPSIMTPTMIEQGLPRPVQFEARTMRYWEDATMAPTRRFLFEHAAGEQLIKGIAVLAFAGDELVGAGVTPIEPVHQGDQRWLASGIMHIDPASVELWGIAADHGGAAAPCIRIAEPVMQYVVREIDLDCDLTFDSQDCNPFAYCDDPSLASCDCMPP